MSLFLPESVLSNYLPSLTFIMIGFLIGYINIRSLNMSPFSVQKNQYHDTNTTFNVIYYFNFYDGSWSSYIFNIHISRFLEFFRCYCFCIIGIISAYAISLRWLIAHHYASLPTGTLKSWRKKCDLANFAKLLCLHVGVFIFLLPILCLCSLIPLLPPCPSAPAPLFVCVCFSFSLLHIALSFLSSICPFWRTRYKKMGFWCCIGYVV